MKVWVILNIFTLTLLLRHGDPFRIVWIRNSLKGHLLKSISILFINKRSQMSRKNWGLGLS